MALETEVKKGLKRHVDTSSCLAASDSGKALLSTFGENQMPVSSTPRGRNDSGAEVPPEKPFQEAVGHCQAVGFLQTTSCCFEVEEFADVCSMWGQQGRS